MENYRQHAAPKVNFSNIGEGEERELHEGGSLEQVLIVPLIAIRESPVWSGQISLPRERRVFHESGQ